ncbi:MAG: hypothetical protein ACYC9M_03015 [Desulfobulbaceae bacterium]
MTMTALSPAPSTTDPDNFAARADELLGALPTFVTEANALEANVVAKEASAVAAQSAAENAQAAAEAQVALAAGQVTLAMAQKTLAESAAQTAINAPGTNATSTTGLTIDKVVQTLTIQPGKALVPGMWVICADTAAPGTNYMAGPITAYNTETGSLTFTATVAVGAGTLAAWTVSLTAPGGAGLASNTFTGPQAYSDQQASQAMLKDCGVVFLDKGPSGTATQTLDYTSGSHQKITATGAHTIATSNWPPSGNLGELLLELVNGGAYTITWPTVNWIKTDGTTTTTFSANGVTLQASGTDFIVLWSRDGGATIYGKVIR